MPRYFIEVAYHGAGFAGFQKQQNANTIQAEVEKALGIYFRSAYDLTGSSRTDSGVHALSNFFHFDMPVALEEGLLIRITYHLNAILPNSIVIKRILPVSDDAHCRFNALSRTYEYSIYQEKDPFLEDRAYFYPYTVDMEQLNKAAGIILTHKNFESFSKKSTQVFTYNCSIFESEWSRSGNLIIYRVTANRFLRGMVRGLVGTMLKVGRNKTEMGTFESIISSLDSSLVDFSVPPQGLTLLKVSFP